MKRQPVIVVWDKNGKFFQIWTADYNNNDGIEHGKKTAQNLSGSYQVLEDKEDLHVA